MKANREVENLCLFPNGRDRMGIIGNGKIVAFGDCLLRAAFSDDGGFDLENSSISRSDARIMGHGKIKPAPKFSEKSPDFKGYMVDPCDRGDTPVRYDVVAWWKVIRNGDNAGQKYLSVCLTKTDQVFPQLRSRPAHAMMAAA